MKVGSLFAEIGFKVDQKGIESFSNAMKAFQKTVKDGLKDLREYARAAREISQAMREAYVPTQKERQQRYRANTRYISASARKTNSDSRYENAVVRQMNARALLDLERAKFFEQDSKTRASNAKSRERQLDLKEKGLIGTHTGKYSAGIIQILRGILGFNVAGIAGGVAGMAGFAHPIVSAIAIGVKAIVGAIQTVMKTVREGIRYGMAYRDYMAFTGRSTSGISKLLAASLNTTNLTPEDIMKDVAGFEKEYWNMFFGGGNPRAWQMMGILPTGIGEVDIKNILASIYSTTGGFENRGLARSLLSQFGLSEEYITLIEELVRQNPEQTFDELFSRTKEQINLIEEGNKTLREYDREWQELKIELAKTILDSGLINILKSLVRVLEELVLWLKSDKKILESMGIKETDSVSKIVGGSVLENLMPRIFEKPQVIINSEVNNSVTVDTPEEAADFTQETQKTTLNKAWWDNNVAYRNSGAY